MSWIKTIDYSHATGALRKLYDRCKGPKDAIDHVLTIHSLRPHTLQGHLVLYKSVLHHSGNTLPKWYLEVLGTYVSRLNGCDYCDHHHRVGIQKNLPKDRDYENLMAALKAGNFTESFSNLELQGIRYAVKLSTDPTAISETDIDALRNVGFSDGEILELNQVVSYFNYVNRVVLGLGVRIEDGHIGMSPSGEDEEDWTHH